MLFRQIFDQALSQYSYLIGCQRTKEAILFDPERDVDRYVAAAEAEGLTLTAVAETHIHADFLSGSRDLAQRLGAVVYLSGAGDDADWQYRWPNGEPQVELLPDGDRFEIGKIRFDVVHTPGHTPEHVCFLVTDVGGGASEPMGLLSGDFLFVGDLGRPDLLESAAGEVGAMKPAAAQLWESTHRLEAMAGHLQIWPGHGAGSACGKVLGAVPTSTLGYERRFNASLELAAQGREVFVDGILEGQPEPPLYFARMKKQNRDGVPEPHDIPSPAVLEAGRIATASAEGAVVVDCRRDKTEFLAAHWPGALWAPWGGADFLAITGSYLEPEQEMLLLAPAADGEAIARALYRIGLDRVGGLLPVDDLPALLAIGCTTTESVGWEAVAAARDSHGELVLDVRRQAEFEAGSVPGAANIAHTRLRQRLDELPRDKQLLVHCETGFRATAATAFLERQGFRVRHVGAPFRDWRPASAAAPGG